jgi:flagellar hook assembly protein FlgD
MEVYDVSGRRVRSLFDGPVDPGTQSVLWDGRDDAGHRVASGVYWMGVRTSHESKTARMVMIR